MENVARGVASEEPDENVDSGKSDDEWFQKQVDSLRGVSEGAERVKSLGRRPRRIRRQPAAARAAAPAAPEMEPREGPPPPAAPEGPPRAVALPLLPRQQRAVPWGAGGHFVLAPVFSRGTLKAFSATCRLHTADGLRCNASLTLGENLTLEDAERRIKEWCVRGLGIEDTPGGKHEHMLMRPREWAEGDLLPTDEVEALAWA